MYSVLFLPLDCGLSRETVGFDFVNNLVVDESEDSGHKVAYKVIWHLSKKREFGTRTFTDWRAPELYPYKERLWPEVKDNDEDRLANCPNMVNPDLGRVLVQFWGTPTYCLGIALSKINRESIRHKMGHMSGRKGHCRVRDKNVFLILHFCRMLAGADGFSDRAEANISPDSPEFASFGSEEGPGIEDFEIIGEAKPGYRLLGCRFHVRGASLCMFQWVYHLRDGTRQYIEGKYWNDLFLLDALASFESDSFGNTILRLKEIDFYFVYLVSLTHSLSFCHSGATNPEYVVTADDMDKFLVVECIPMDDRVLQVAASPNGDAGEITQCHYRSTMER
ncbi:hypothetical protein RHSIM_Rhsim02G0103300 [Rhododendron simsii]|uniref:Uncharacterized protein n=1 Tax=Rhododendron simsii TaxID=118357 RepID=A0A834LV72_RHOSS|nr:hypothetical protein RHSIM_Rhsim02G0103300 [Rhododendron simsii]